MKKCPVCNKVNIDDKYSMCLTCLQEAKGANSNIDLKELLTTLKHLNWNAGSIMKNQRLYYLFKMSDSYGETRTLVKRKIYEYFLNELDKDLKQLKQIRKEQEK